MSLTIFQNIHFSFYEKTKHKKKFNVTLFLPHVSIDISDDASHC